MSIRLAAQELVTSLALRQRMTCQVTQHVRGVRLHLVRIGAAPAGSVFVQFQNSAGVAIATSATRLISSLGTGTNWFGFVPFNLDCGATEEEIYYVALGCSGYTYSDAAHLAWIVDSGMGSRKYDCDYTPTSYFDAPLDLEMWERELVTKGTYP